MYSSAMVEYSFERARFLGRAGSQEGMRVVCRTAGDYGAGKAGATLSRDGLKLQTEMTGRAE